MINVAYDRILVYDEYDKPLFPYPNLGKYKPYGHWHFDFKNLDNSAVEPINRALLVTLVGVFEGFSFSISFNFFCKSNNLSVASETFFIN